MTVFGLLGLEQPGFSLACFLQGQGMVVVTYDENAALRQNAASAGLVVTSSVQAVLLHIPTPRIVCLTPVVEPFYKKVSALLLAELTNGDVVLDFNEYYHPPENLFLLRGICYFLCKWPALPFS